MEKPIQEQEVGNIIGPEACKIEESTEFNIAKSLNTIKGLNEEESENYNKKVELINSNDFIEQSKDLKKIDKGYILKDKQRNIFVNNLIIRNILLKRVDKTYREFIKKYQKKWEWDGVLNNCKENAKNVLAQPLGKNHCNNKLIKLIKIARGELFLFKAGESYIALEIKNKNKTDKIMDLDGKDILENQIYYVARHISDDVDLLQMEKVLLKGKYILDKYQKNKDIKTVVSNSRLFDREFNDFWMNKRSKEEKVPSRIVITERLKNYGGFLEDLEEPKNQNFVIKNLLYKTKEEKILLKNLDEYNNKEGNLRNFKQTIESGVIPNLDNSEKVSSMLKAVLKYRAEGKKIKEGGSYINLEKLEKFKIEEGQESENR